MCQDCGCSITEHTHEHHHDELQNIHSNPQLNDKKTAISIIEGLKNSFDVLFFAYITMSILSVLIAWAGFTLLGSSIGLVLFAAIQVAQRAMNYGLLGPVKEMLFTVVDRESKYKSKNFIDTVVYRGSDVTASWLFKGMMTVGLSLSQIAWVYLPIMAVWGVGAWHLGKAYTRLKVQWDART